MRTGRFGIDRHGLGEDRGVKPVSAIVMEHRGIVHQHAPVIQPFGKCGDHGRGGIAVEQVRR